MIGTIYEVFVFLVEDENFFYLKKLFVPNFKYVMK